MKNLLSGCDGKDSSTTLSSSSEDAFTSFEYTASLLESATDTLCQNYCMNVLRGCLAPPLLYLPAQALNADPSFKIASNFVPSPTNVWQWLLSSSPDRPGLSYIEHTLDAIWTSLNATKLVELIQQGLQLARVDGQIRKANGDMIAEGMVLLQQNYYYIYFSSTCVPNFEEICLVSDSW
ncbi:unnamed protein product [Echinostoma caproni]|uniref:DEP domain-containing protein n=1 Tax=Echinostoma caproni TaxID=27848 RepID=A0A183AHX6_9TREM|nr:unnamed protein product [Echinostoma caproni]